MRLVYCTDLHGNHQYYRDVLEIATDFKALAIINGGDMLPKTQDGSGKVSIPESQEEFIDIFLKQHLKNCKARGIRYLAQPGNDDCMSVYADLIQLAVLGLLELINIKWVEVDGWHIKGLPYVPDYPFGLKDWTRLDTEGFICPRQISQAVISNKAGFQEVGMSSQAWHNKRPTLQAILEEDYIPPPFKSILVAHSPPKDTPLDVCADYHHVGSEAVRKHIEKHQLPITLHGHIHESPTFSHQWYHRLGRSTCIQPGNAKQFWPTSIVLIDTDEKTIRSFGETINFDEETGI